MRLLRLALVMMLLAGAVWLFARALERPRTIEVMTGEVRREQHGGSVVADTARCIVARVIDGDTLTCTTGERVRLLLIDAPEGEQRPFADSARRGLARLAPRGSLLRVERDVQRRDRFGRELAYLYTENGAMVNEEMVRLGYAVVLVYPPNVRYVERIRAAAAEARREGRGLYAVSGFACEPRDYRRGTCR